MIIALWLCKKMSVFLEVHTKACKGEMMLCLGFALKHLIVKKGKKEGRDGGTSETIVAKP